MRLLSTSILSLVATSIAMIASFIITKLVSIYVGPSGLALMGQMQNLVNVVIIFSGGFLRTAVIKYTAEYHEFDKKKKIWSASLKVMLVLCFFAFLLMQVLSEELSNYFLRGEEYSFIFSLFSLTLPFFILNIFLMSILNGLSLIKEYVVLKTTISISSVTLMYPLIMYWGITGVLVTIVVSQVLAFIVFMLFLPNKSWVKLENFTSSTERLLYSKLFKFAAITIASVFSSNAAIFLIRTYIYDNVSPEAAGLWQGITFVSQSVLVLVTMTMTTYMLPTLSRLNYKYEINNELFKIVKLMLPLVLAISISMYVLRDFIIWVLFTDQFSSMRELFSAQMLGNVIKAIGWLFGYVFVAKGWVKFTVSTEIFFALSWLIMTIYLVDMYGVIGASYAYLLNNFLHALCMMCMFRIARF